MQIQFGRWFGVGDLLIAGTVINAVAQKFPDDEVLFMVERENADKEGWIQMVYPDYRLLHDDSGREFGGKQPLQIIPPRIAWCDLEMPNVKRPNYTHAHDVWGANCGVAPVRYSLQIPVEDLQWAMDYFCNPTQTAILSPFGRNVVNAWPNSYWLRLIDELLNANVRVVINDNEHIRNENFNSVGCNDCGGNYQPDYEVFKDFEKLPQVEPSKTAALIACADLMIGIDSGLCHAACILDKPTIILTAPTKGPKIYGWYQTAKVIEAFAPCAPCYMPWLTPMTKQCSRGCPLLKVITPDIVFQEAILSLREESTEKIITLDARKMLQKTSEDQ